MPETTTEVEQGSNGHVEPMTPKQLARLLHTDARTVRKFLRMQYGKIGQGNRWGLDPDDMTAFVHGWNAWREKIEARGEKEPEIEEPTAGDGEEEMEVE